MWVRELFRTSLLLFESKTKRSLARTGTEGLTGTATNVLSNRHRSLFDRSFVAVLVSPSVPVLAIFLVFVGIGRQTGHPFLLKLDTERTRKDALFDPRQTG